MRSPNILAVATFSGFLFAGGTALANPKPLPFSYGYGTQPEGALEVEQYLDVVPVRVPREAPDGTQQAVTSLRYDLQTELEYGLTDRVELGFYFVFRQGPSAGTPDFFFRGVKQRARIRLAERGEWPLDVALYFEIAEFHNELEFEEKLLLSKQVGRFSFITNLWVEQEWYFQSEEVKYIFNPTAGFTYEIQPGFLLGAEYWARGRFDSDDASSATDDPSTDTRHYAGPTVMLERGRVWTTLGVYPRLDTLGSGVPVNDLYGPVWVRLLLGLEMF
jgi:hypothetical protein